MVRRKATYVGGGAAAITALIWVMALRPWAWWDIQPGPPTHALNTPPVTEAELLALAALALLPVVVVILFAERLARTKPHRS